MLEYKLEMPPEQLPALTLAYIGDAVYELYVRTHLLEQSHKVHSLHRLAINRVNNNTQSDLLAKVESELTEEEMAIVRRGRNANVHTIPHSADRAQYQKATALEALFGWLYLQGRHERINELFNRMMEANDAA